MNDSYCLDEADEHYIPGYLLDIYECLLTEEDYDALAKDFSLAKLARLQKRLLERVRSYSNDSSVYSDAYADEVGGALDEILGVLSHDDKFTRIVRAACTDWFSRDTTQAFLLAAILCQEVTVHLPTTHSKEVLLKDCRFCHATYPDKGVPFSIQFSDKIKISTTITDDGGKCALTVNDTLYFFPISTNDDASFEFDLDYSPTYSYSYLASTFLANITRSNQAS